MRSRTPVSDEAEPETEEEEEGGGGGSSQLSNPQPRKPPDPVVIIMPAKTNKTETDEKNGRAQKVPDPIIIHPPVVAMSGRPNPNFPARPHEPLLSPGKILTASVLGRQTESLKELYVLGRKLGQGQFGTTFLCIEKKSGKEYACKSIAKRKLISQEDVDDVRREIHIMHHLSDHPNIVTIKGAYEDANSVHLVMELCAGGELFDRIIQRGHYSERKAARLTRTIVGVVEACHSLGVMHRDLKPENFLFSDKSEDSALKTTDFGLSVFFKPGMNPLLMIKTSFCS